MSDLPPFTAVNVPLVKFLTITNCPPSWKSYNLYLIRDERVVFYVGQSHCAFQRVWEHLQGGIHGHAIVGRFILVNWPKSARFSVELLSSRHSDFARVAYNLNEAERSLIEQYTPCFNVSLNNQPAELPTEYLPPNAPIKYLKNFRRMLREAEIAAQRLEHSRDTEWD